MSELIWAVHESPVGSLTVVAGPRGVRSIRFPGGTKLPAGAVERPMPELAAQLGAYFAGERRGFELDLDMQGDPLDMLVWEQLHEIPYGSTCSYGELAGRLDESAFPDHLEPYMRARVVGAALGRNPIPVVVPCHRVVGADGSLVGFGGGVERKRILLEIEKALPDARRRREPENVQLDLL